MGQFAELISKAEKAETALDVIAVFLRLQKARPLSDDVDFWLGMAAQATSEKRALGYLLLAAMELVPGGCTWTLEPDAAWLRWISKDDVEEAQCALSGRGGEHTCLALLIVTLRALEAQTDE